MYEIEVKVPARLDTVRDRLRSLGADRVTATTQRDRYYDHPARSFAASDEALRLRRETPDGHATLTYKGPRTGGASKTREELETAVGEPDRLDGILVAIGFEAAGEVTKERERFRLDGYTITLDRVTGLGEFVEVETHGDRSAVDDLEAGAVAMLERLDLDPDDRVSTSYLELLLDPAH